MSFEVTRPSDGIIDAHFLGAEVGKRKRESALLALPAQALVEEVLLKGPVIDFDSRENHEHALQKYIDLVRNVDDDARADVLEYIFTHVYDVNSNDPIKERIKFNKCLWERMIWSNRIDWMLWCWKQQPFRIDNVEMVFSIVWYTRSIEQDGQEILKKATDEMIEFVYTFEPFHSTTVHVMYYGNVLTQAIIYACLRGYKKAAIAMLETESLETHVQWKPIYEYFVEIVAKADVELVTYLLNKYFWNDKKKRYQTVAMSPAGILLYGCLNSSADGREDVALVLMNNYYIRTRYMELEDYYDYCFTTANEKAFTRLLKLFDYDRRQMGLGPYEF
jgi:hypothetical protein